MTKTTLLATLFTVLASACASTPDAGTHDDRTGGGDGKADGDQTGDIDLGYLASEPATALANQTFDLAPGHSLRFRNDLNQIFGIYGLADVDIAATGLTFDSELVEESSGDAGDTSTYEVRVTVADDAAPGDHDLVTLTPYQTRNDPRWKFHFVVRVEAGAAY